jgi:hypothetical protein
VDFALLFVYRQTKRQEVDDMSDEPNIIVTCHTPQCENENIEIPFFWDLPDYFIYCGPCSVLITDIKEI